MTNSKIEDLLSEHKIALLTYREWDEKVKELLKGRRANDLSDADMERYRAVAARRDAAYDQMRHLERMLLDDIPEANSGKFKSVRPDTEKDKP